MLVHHGLDGVVAIPHAERERAIVVRFHVTALGVVYAMTVHQEVYTLYRDAGAVVHHIAREAAAIGDGELMHRLVVALGIEGDAIGIDTGLKLQAGFTYHLHLVYDDGGVVVRQFVDDIVTTLVGRIILHCCAVEVGIHANIGHACAIVEAHVTLHAASVLTLAHFHLGLTFGADFALVHRFYLIFIYCQRRYAGVFVTQIGQVGSHLYPCVVTLVLNAAQHGKEVYWVTVGVPS